MTTTIGDPSISLPGAPAPTVSVITPTFDRPAAVARLLASLACQTLAPTLFEVILIDDGSTADLTAALAPSDPYPFPWRCVRQTNQGPTAARNHGAALSQAAVLIFIDDDMTLHPDALRQLAQRCQRRPGIVWLGTLLDPGQPPPIPPPPDFPINFILCKTGLLAINRHEFFDLDQFQDPTGGWPNWDDVDFGYRAHLAGYAIWQCGAALAEHWDYAGHDLDAACARWRRASRSAVRLFQRHPALQTRLPMFADKTPIAWRTDPPPLILRKLTRRLASHPWALRGLRQAERLTPVPALRQTLRRWLIGGHIYRGFQDGLRDSHPAGASGPTASTSTPAPGQPVEVLP